MKVSELGEFGLIDRLAGIANRSQDKRKTSWKQLVVGIGDDAVAWQSEPGIQLATVDSLVQDVHFTLDTITWPELGWKALAVNLSDIAAMGGIPRYVLVSLALPGATEAEDMTALYAGMTELAKQFDVAIIGGNIARATIIVIDVTVLGVASGESLLKRSAARPADLIAVTGYLGSAAAGLEMLSRKLKFNAKDKALLRQAFLKPNPRVAEGQLLVKNGVRAGMDISDGLLADLKHICEASGVSAQVETERLPIHPAVRRNFGNKAIELALSGGEDYELLFTASHRTMAKVKEALSCPVTIIGEVEPNATGEIALIDSRGKRFQLERTGWDHFAR